MSTSIFVSYAEADRAAAEQLLRHLVPFVRTGRVSVWHRGLAIPGVDLGAEVERRIGNAGIIILLVSPDFEIDRDDDISRALAQRTARNARVVPVLIRPLALDDLRYSSLEMLLIAERQDRDQAWVDVVKGIRRVVESIEQEAPTVPAVQSALAPPVPAIANAPAAVNRAASPIKVLFMSAEPSDAPTLQIGREVREIDRRLIQSRFRDSFQLEQSWAMTPQDLSQNLLRHRPTILHYSGHSSAKRGIWLEDAAGRAVAVPPAALSSLLALLKPYGLRGVVLNACHTAEQASLIAQQLDFVVGMSDTIEEEPALAFSAGFYTALAEGIPVPEAVQFGAAQIAVSGLTGAELLRLEVRPGLDPSTLRLV